MKEADTYVVGFRSVQRLTGLSIHLGSGMESIVIKIHAEVYIVVDQYFPCQLDSLLRTIPTPLEAENTVLIRI